MSVSRIDSAANAARAQATGLTRALAALMLFGIAFGYIEAAVVVYLRAAYEPLHERLYPRAHGDPHLGGLLPFLPLDRLQSAGPAFVNWTAIELAREAATLLLLAAAALCVAHSFRQWFAAFLLTFGLWDLFYYVFLKVLIDWPVSLLTWDILFLVPVPWVAPVLAPALVALVMVTAGTVTFRREAIGQPLRLTAIHWLLFFASGLLLITAFCEDYRNVAQGGLPNPFDWPVFAVGLAIGVGTFLAACGRVVPHR